MVLPFWLWESLWGRWVLAEGVLWGLSSLPVRASADSSFENRFSRGEMPCSRNAEEGLNCKIYLCSLGALAKGEIVAGTSVHVENYLEYG